VCRLYSFPQIQYFSTMTHKAKSVDIIPVDLLLSAYAGGYFPMSEPGSELLDLIIVNVFVKSDK